MFRLIFTLFLSSILISGCASKKKKEETAPAPQESEPTITTSSTGATPSSTPDTAGEPVVEINGSSDQNKAGGLQTVHFEFNSAELTSEEMQNLEANAEYLKNNPSLKVQAEGHCDERGSIEYNLSLGQRRAKWVKDYLVKKGISSDRLSVTSYGKEHPLDMESTESAWAQNRRANFVVTSK